MCLFMCCAENRAFGLGTVYSINWIGNGTNLANDCEQIWFSIFSMRSIMKNNIVNNDYDNPIYVYGHPKKQPRWSFSGCFCVYSDSSSFEYIRSSLEKTLLSNLEQDVCLPFQVRVMVMSKLLSMVVMNTMMRIETKIRLLLVTTKKRELWWWWWWNGLSNVRWWPKKPTSD